MREIHVNSENWTTARRRRKAIEGQTRLKNITGRQASDLQAFRMFSVDLFRRPYKSIEI